MSTSLNLKDIGNFPDHYRLFFFASESHVNDPNYQQDLTRIEEVPPSKLELITNPTY